MSVIRIPVTSNSGHNMLVSVSEWDYVIRDRTEVPDGRHHSHTLKVGTKFLLTGPQSRLATFDSCRPLSRVPG